MSQHEIKVSDEVPFYQNSFHSLETIYADAVANKIAKLCQKNECNVSDRWQTYGMERRVNEKCWNLKTVRQKPLCIQGSACAVKVYRK